MKVEEVVSTAVEAADHELLARHLSDHARGLLAGDAPERRIIEQRRPSKVLQLGILPPLPVVEPGSDETPQELARRWGEPPSTMSLDFLLRMPSEERVAQIEVAAAFSFYVQRYPTRAEQSEWFNPGADLSNTDDESNAPSGRMRLKGVYERFDIETGRIPVEIRASDAPQIIELSLDDQITSVLGSILTDSQTVYPFGDTQTLSVDALDNDEAWSRAIREAEGDARQTPLSPPAAKLLISWQRESTDCLRVLVSLMNESPAPRRRNGNRRKKGEPRQLARDMHLFNSRIRVYEATGKGTFEPTRFLQAPEDFRYAPTRQVWVTGQNCVGRRADIEEDAERPLLSDTWPLFRQRRMVPNSDPNLQLTFSELADQATCSVALASVLAAMKSFEGEWRRVLADWPDQESKAHSETALQDFLGDIRGFELGLRCLGEDPLLARAFREANLVFHRQGERRRTPIKSWRLFQVVYQVIHLAALRARESDDPELSAELDIVDVLWFPTGGGKTEAYLGLITTLLFYDRMRGKRRGVSGILRFPLRMLSVQQLQRILAVLWFAEGRRKELLSESNGSDAGLDVSGDPFALGYWVGRQQASPNSLIDTRDSTSAENILWWARYLASETREETNRRRIITSCPNPDCDGGAVELEADTDLVRLRHVCRTCGDEVPVYVSDEEVYRYLPSVLVCTVDKLAHVARAKDFTNIIAGPQFRCPKHGYFTWHSAVWQAGNPMPTADDRCLAGSFCDVSAQDYEAVPDTHDPCPGLQVQDELHLLEEELGTFNAHYETLMEELQRSFGTGKPAKLLAATATIEAYEDQVRELYARRARAFPSAGWSLEKSFYSDITEDARRLYVGALPYRPDPAEFGEKVQGFFHQEISRLQDDITLALTELRGEGLHASRDEAWLERALFDYELSLGYVNQKRDADRIHFGLSRLHAQGELPDSLRVKVLVGDATPLAEIADTLEEIETQQMSNPRPDRLRALVATSIVSHGVDIDRLNLMVMNGMTPSVADYIQSSSRAGRTLVGLIVVGYDRRKVRDASFFQYFIKYHEFLDRLISPVPVNRFAKFAVGRTVPGLVSALLMHVYGRKRLDTHSKGKDPTKPRVKSLSVANEARRWWLGPEPPTNKLADLKARLLRALGIGKEVLAPSEGGFSPMRVFDPGMEEALSHDAGEELDKQITFIQQPTSGATSNVFHPKPLTSFRDVDEPMEFAVTGADYERIQFALAGGSSSGGRNQ